MVMWVAMRTYDITLFEDIVMCDVNKENSSDLYPYMKEQTNTLGYLDDKIEATKRYEKIG